MRKLLAFLLAAAMVVTLVACGSEEESSTSASQEASATASGISSETGSLKAGAGTAEIYFPEEVFASENEGFTGGVHDPLHVRVLLLENGESAALVSIEMVQLSEDLIGEIQTAISEATDIPVSNIWVHCTHTTTTFHAPSEEAELAAYTEAMLEATTAATQDAVDTFQPATMGIGTGVCDVNVNRDIEINGVWYYGLGSDMYSDHEMTVVRFDDLSGDPIGMYISYGIKPSASDIGRDATDRLLSADVTGVACTVMEEEYDCPVMFCMPAAADQMPKDVALNYVDDGEGGAKTEILTQDEAMEIVDDLGDEMGNAAAGIAKDIVCDVEDTAVTVEDTSFSYENFDEDGTVDTEISVITVGDTLALVGFKPELNAITGSQLREASPYATTLLISFMNGDQKYMPDEEAYDLETYEYQRTGYAKGCAEEFVSVASEFLQSIREGINTTDDGATGAVGSYLGGTVEIGGYTWTILAESDDEYLILCDSSVATRPYQASGGAVTWETSDIRAYLNGDFYEQTFSDNEKKWIVETTVENPANSHYGINGGEATQDFVFLLDLDEAEDYLNGTDLIKLTDEDGNGLWWYLRSPGEATDSAAGVTATGSIDYHGTSNGVSESEAIRPAMWVSEEAMG